MVYLSLETVNQIVQLTIDTWHLQRDIGNLS